MKKVLFFIIILTFLSFSTSVLSDLILAEGKATGQWYNPERNGEGFFIEIFSISEDEWISLAMFTYDDSGKQLWVTGVAELSSAQVTVTIPVNAWDGPKWGPDYDKDDLNPIPFGQITVSFPSCDTGLFQVITDNELANGNYSLIRLTDIEGIECNDEPPEQTYTSGRWQGPGVCFYVSSDGKSITEIDSSCDADKAFDSRLDGIATDLDPCDVEVNCKGLWPIKGGSFSCVSETGSLASGSFNSFNSASGIALEGNTEFGVASVCSADWTATPD
jgi:hypothetical protein